MNYYAKRFFGQQGIVRDGLKLWLDASNPASYSGSGTTWYDLSGNGNNGTMVGGILWDGQSMYFDGVNDYVFFQNYIRPPQTLTDNLTWSVWVYTYRSVKSDVIIGNRFGSELSDFAKLTTNAFEWYDTIIQKNLSPLVWHNISIVKENNVIKYHYNGALSLSQTTTIVKNSAPFYVGGDPGGEFSLSKIASVAVYDKALTSNEVIQNYNATKSKYGL